MTLLIMVTLSAPSDEEPEPWRRPLAIEVPPEKTSEEQTESGPAPIPGEESPSHAGMEASEMVEKKKDESAEHSMGGCSGPGEPIVLESEMKRCRELSAQRKGILLVRLTSESRRERYESVTCTP
jgi:hypothetical protein